MATASLSAKKRANVGKGIARKLRAAGEVPAVIYGHGREPQALALNAFNLDRMLEKVSYRTTVIELDIEGATARTLIREVQRHPFKRDILHVDFQELVAGEKVTVQVPLVFVGTPEGVRTGGGILETAMRELTITVDPADIPNHIDVDVGNLTIGHSLHVSDLAIPAGVEVLEDANATVCLVAVPKAVVEPTPEETAAATAAAEPEVIRKAKTDEEEAEGAEAKTK
ncbi:MAG: 50S ribosomal protein L25/general stress protein Ctc [Gemmatimonadetes bacterium]|nr:50S ribosomal protein L25/general stress protein Ctc [Gemmatimonadota bacterium]MBI3568463.1 50S ribosomal protein L25/general stress protein Ctc [Gemmatimonadota bacterium]